MRTVNKIKERDMDPSFIMSLISDAQSLDVTALLGNYLRKDDKILRTSLPTEYVNEVSEEIIFGLLLITLRIIIVKSLFLLK